VESENVQLDDSLRVALSNQDSLLVLLNDITDGMNQIKDLEKILGSTNDLTAESQSRKDQIRNDMYSIQQALQERRERLAELEKKLKSSQGYNATLQKTIDNLKAEIATQETTISTLRNDLAAAKIQIADLGTKVDSLSTTVASVTEEKVKAQEETQNVTNELNTCYYAIGTKKELKEAKIIETGFLRKTKLLQADFQQSYFTKADKRTMTVIPTQSKKAKILTNMPSDSYVIEDEGDTKVIKVTNPERFWSLSNYLVIQVD
jgi:chromosome segregation ATPase